MRQLKNRLVYKTISDETHIIRAGNIISVRYNDRYIAYFNRYDLMDLLATVIKKEVKPSGISTKE
jgi:hypothetical protein